MRRCRSPPRRSACASARIRHSVCCRLTTMLLRLESPARWRARSVLSPRRRRIGWAALVAAVLHPGVLAAILLVMHHHRSLLVEPADMPATVELVMSPPGSDRDASATAPRSETPPAAPATTQETQPPPAPSEAAAEPEKPAPPGPS